MIAGEEDLICLGRVAYFENGLAKMKRGNRVHDCMLMVIVNLENEEEFEAEDLLDTSFLGTSAAMKRPLNNNEGICVRASKKTLTLGVIAQRSTSSRMRLNPFGIGFNM
jgi:hypothetical protein